MQFYLSADMDSLYALLSPIVEHLSVWEVETPGMHETYHGMLFTIEATGYGRC